MFLRHSSPMRATPLRTAWINVTKCSISKEVKINEDVILNSDQEIKDLLESSIMDVLGILCLSDQL